MHRDRTSGGGGRRPGHIPPDARRLRQLHHVGRGGRCSGFPGLGGDNRGRQDRGDGARFPRPASQGCSDELAPARPGPWRSSLTSGGRAGCRPQGARRGRAFRSLPKKPDLAAGLSDHAPWLPVDETGRKARIRPSTKRVQQLRSRSCPHKRSPPQGSRRGASAGGRRAAPTGCRRRARRGPRAPGRNFSELRTARVVLDDEHGARFALRKGPASDPWHGASLA
jgi:hypothetical protein